MLARLVRTPTLGSCVRKVGRVHTLEGPAHSQYSSAVRCSAVPQGAAQATASYASFSTVKMPGEPGVIANNIVATPQRWGLTSNGLTINSSMDGGNVEVLSLQPDIRLRIIPDPWCQTDNRAHFQWFSFQACGVKNKPLNMTITNAGEASYPKGWENYQAVASYDLNDWFRVPTQWLPDSGHLVISHTPTADTVHYAYFAPYPMARHDQLIHRTQMCEGVTLKVIGYTLDGRPMQLLQIGEPAPDKKRIWVIARQHPGETMAEYFMEGLLARLTDTSDAVSTALRAKTVFYCIPNMCPDGSYRGHLRTNAAGFNLNRAWGAPDPSIAPEVACTLAEMDRTGLDFLLDVHGDEALPYNFVAGNDGIPAWDARLETLQNNFKAAYCRHSPDFQGVHGYAIDPPGQANMVLCSKAIGQRFNALSLTLEMPFKDNIELPNPRTGWSPQRSMKLGAASLGAIHDVVDQLR